ncbi:MAG: hypothetical protein ACXABY_19080 [Candidatus Thorarchaeota archaeon]|jgi:hypothetical protein
MALTSAITITQGLTLVHQRTAVLTGTNSSDIATVEVSGVIGSVVQPTTTTWRAEIRLEPGDNVVSICGIDLADNVTATVTKTITQPKLTHEQHEVFGPFDEYGVVLSLPRLPGEKNLQYRARLFDVRQHPADATVIGLTQGASRALGIRIQAGITLSSPFDAEIGTSRAINGSARNTGVVFELTSLRFITEECLTVEPATLSVSLTRYPQDTSVIQVNTLNGDRIDQELWAYDRKTNRILLQDRELEGLDIVVKFVYVHKIALKGLTLADLKTEIEAVVDSDGNPYFQADIVTDPVTRAEDLIPTSGFLIINDVPVDLERCCLRLRELHDIDFQESKLNEHGHAIGTQLAAWAQQINTQTRIVWNATLLDDSQWEPLGPEPHLGALPHLSDGERGYWASLDPTDATRYTRKDFRRYNGVSPINGALLKYKGIEPLEFQSGTGTRKDLKVLDIVEN